MKVTRIDPPRRFTVGPSNDIELNDCACIELDPNEQVTFRTSSGGEYDVVRKAWGFYAMPSLNGRLPAFGLRAALVRSGDSKVFVLIVERNCEREFDTYLAANGLRVIGWLDNEGTLATIERAIGCDEHS